MCQMPTIRSGKETSRPTSQRTEKRTHNSSENPADTRESTKFRASQYQTLTTAQDRVGGLSKLKKVHEHAARGIEWQLSREGAVRDHETGAALIAWVPSRKPFLKRRDMLRKWRRRPVPVVRLLFDLFDQLYVRFLAFG